MSTTTQFDVALAPKYVPPELQRKVTAPIVPTELQEFFLNPDIQYMIDCKNSRLKGPILLTYLNNLSVPCDVVVDLENYDEYSQLLKAYLNQRAVVKSNVLTALAGEAILYFANVERKLHPCGSPVSDAFLQRFCEENEEVLSIWRIFLDSIVVYMVRHVLRSDFHSAQEIAIVDDRDVIGHNIVNLLYAPDYLRTYLANTTFSAQVYFTQQFEKPMFNGRDLSYYFWSKSNSANQLLNSELIKAMQSKEGKIFVEYVQEQMAKDTPT